MIINKILGRHIMLYESEKEANDDKKGFTYMIGNINAAIKAGIITELESVEDLEPHEIIDISNQLTAALNKSIKPDTKN
ncbi:MAG: hypothetical protein UW18_C0011G0025 [Microgenomates group bacterium GW2011_GWF1_44_10]|nr:MAG: hypothetical protein UW18_C0011G0025 [Microgenomates group bacterium GW2011_GWF1_44_10]